MEKNSISRMLGPPPGLIGYDEGGVLTEAVRRAPHSVILLDELEKADPEILNLLLQVIDDGILTDGKGRTVSFKNTIIIMTSNIGSKRILNMVKETPGGRPRYAMLAGVVKSELEKALRPEFLNRIDDIVIFQPLTDHELYMIATMMCLSIIARTKWDRDIKITVEGRLMEKMVADGSKAASQFGARPMRRAVQRIFEDSLSDAVMKNFLTSGDSAIFDIDDSSNDEECDIYDMRSYYVTVRRESDGQVFQVAIEESCRDMAADDNAEAINGFIQSPTSKSSREMPNGAQQT
jgi:ATP-dependent Clp protease ATP-binding subunit ClpC